MQYINTILEPDEFIMYKVCIHCCYNFVWVYENKRVDVCSKKEKKIPHNI